MTFRWRLPQFSVVQSRTGRPTCWRLYGLHKQGWRCWFDYTRCAIYVGKPGWVRLQILGRTIFEMNRDCSGLPGKAPRP